MTIAWSEESREFHLRNERISYVLAVLENGALGGLYFGSALGPGRSYRHLARGGPDGFNNRLGDPLRLEYPSAWSGDYRIPALGVELPDGSGVLDLQTRVTPSGPARPASRVCRRPMSRRTRKRTPWRSR